MSDLPVAFAATSREWLARLSGHLYTHGPADVVDVVAEERGLFDHSWRVIVIDASSSLMDAGVVATIHDAGRGVMAIWDPEEPDTKQRATDAGADLLVNGEVSALEFVAELVDLVNNRFTGGRSRDRRRRPAAAPAAVRQGQLVAVGGPVGADPASVALGMARALGRRKETVVVIDADETTPSLAQLLGLEQVPNLSSAVATARANGDLNDTLQAADGYWLLGGLAEPAQMAEVTTHAALGVVLSIAGRTPRTLAVVGPIIENLDRFALSRATLAAADAIVAVGDASPVGLTWLTHWVYQVRLIAPSTPLHLVAAPAPRDRFRRSHVLAELAQIANPASTTLIPDDDARQRAAAWQGQGLRRGPLVRATADLADTVCPKGKR